MYKMKSIKRILPLVLVLMLFVSISFHCQTEKRDQSSLVLIETNLGNIKVKLYNQTPLHRVNFIKLVKEGFYDGTLFHRVIADFMIQGGDPDSRTAQSGTNLGDGGPGYTIPAEIHPELFHKKGALAAARSSDRVNPDKKSSGSQFYIVQGKKFTDTELDQEENRINNMLKQAVFFKFYNTALKNAGNHQSNRAKAQQDAALQTAEFFADSLPYKIPAEHRKVYETIGGSPHLDMNYTVFGEVIEGLDIIDKIAAVPTDENDRPKTDIRIIKMKLIKNQ